MGQPLECNFAIKLRKAEDPYKNTINTILKAGYRVYMFNAPLEFYDSDMNIVGKIQIKEVSVKYLKNINKNDIKGSIFNNLVEFKNWYVSNYNDDIITIVRFEVL